jgi:predicted nicotinamide N-methyase
MSDHLSVGVQTWGSAILLGREMALRPADFGLVCTVHGRPVRVLELGAGTGLLSILCRKLLDLQGAISALPADASSSVDSKGLVVATDFLASVLSNLKICVDLNFPPYVGKATGQVVESGTDKTPESGIHIAKLDWTTFPSFMRARQIASSDAAHYVVEGDDHADKEQMARFVDQPFDLVLASDCVYDGTHAAMLREVAGWVLRLPDPSIEGDMGGTFVGAHSYRLSHSYKQLTRHSISYRL